jgi:hypothetical protein
VSVRDLGITVISFTKIVVLSFPQCFLAGIHIVADNCMLYANDATSYRVNAMAIFQGNKTVPPEEFKSYTVGLFYDPAVKKYGGFGKEISLFFLLRVYNSAL